MSTISKSRQYPALIVTGMFLLGVGLFLLSYIEADYWAEAFKHPLRTFPGEAAPETTLAGIGLLLVMLWVSGICWLLAGAFLHCWVRCHRHERAPAWPRVPYTFSIIVVLIILAFLVRVPFLSQSLWYDEIVAFWYYGQYGPGPIVGNMFTPANHVLQSLGSWVTVTLAGGSLDEWLLRFPSLFVGLLTAWPVFLLARRATNPLGALIATAIILFAPIAVLETTEARGYALMLFFGASASALLFAAIEDKRAELLPIYAIACALGTWSHLVTAVIPIGHFLFIIGLLAFVPSQRRFMLVCLGALALAGVTTILLLSPVIPDLLAESESFEATTIDQPRLFGTEGLGILLGLGGSWSIFSAPVALLLLAIGVASTWNDRCLRRSLLVTGLPIVVALALVIGFGTWIYARFLVFDLAFVALAVTGGILVLARISRALVAVAIVVLALSWSSELWSRWVIPRQPVREIVGEIPNDGSLVASVGIQDMPIVISWYLPDARDRVLDAGPYLGVSNSHLADPRVRWVVLSYPMKSEGPDWPKRLVEEFGFEIRSHKDGWIDDDGDVVLLERSSEIDDGQS